jgi:hypothetical protein
MRRGCGCGLLGAFAALFVVVALLGGVWMFRKQLDRFLGELVIGQLITDRSAAQLTDQRIYVLITEQTKIPASQKQLYLIDTRYDITVAGQCEGGIDHQKYPPKFHFDGEQVTVILGPAEVFGCRDTTIVDINEKCGLFGLICIDQTTRNQLLRDASKTLVDEARKNETIYQLTRQKAEQVTQEYYQNNHGLKAKVLFQESGDYLYPRPTPEKVPLPPR